MLNNLGTNYVLSSKKTEAETAFLKAVSLLKNDKTQTETLANAYRNLAQLKVDQNDFKKASDFSKKQKPNSIKIQNENLEK